MNLDFLTPEEAFAAQLALKDMSVEEKMLFLADLEEKEHRVHLHGAQNKPLEFAKAVYPGFKISTAN